MEFSLNLRWPIVLNASSELLHESDWDSHCFSRFLRGCWWLQVSLERIRTGTIVAPPSRRFQRGMVELQGDTYSGVLTRRLVPLYPRSRAIVVRILSHVLSHSHTG